MTVHACQVEGGLLVLVLVVDVRPVIQQLLHCLQVAVLGGQVQRRVVKLVVLEICQIFNEGYQIQGYSCHLVDKVVGLRLLPQHRLDDGGLVGGGG